VPELPETETIARDLDRAIANTVITDVVVRHADVLRLITTPALRTRVVGTSITHAWRRAKLVVLDLSSGDRLVVQPRFTGALLVDTGSLPERELRYATVTFGLADGRSLHYRDIRRLGTVTLMTPAAFDTYTSALGVEPLDVSFTATRLAAVLGRSRRAVKTVLMDQRHLAGVGNICAKRAWLAPCQPNNSATRSWRCSANRSPHAARAFATTATPTADAAHSPTNSMCTAARAIPAGGAGAG
jgi:formamidopyrimidine-DNA glycosylase